jgi:serine/threonine protein phosphatase 1
VTPRRDTLLDTPTPATHRPAQARFGAPEAAPDLPAALRQVSAELAAVCAHRLRSDDGHGPAAARIGRPGQGTRGGRPGRRPRFSRSQAEPHRRRGEAASTHGQLVYAVGDLHGRYDLLVELLAKISDDSARHAAGRQPVLVMLGDYVDRGPDAARVLEALVWLRRNADWALVTLKGNHEQALLRFLEAPRLGGPWLSFGGDATLQSYGVEPPRPDHGVADLDRARDDLLAAMPAAHLRLLQTLELMATVGDYAFVHAGVAPGAALADQQEADLLWIREEFLESRAPSAHVIVHGHTRTGVTPAVLPHRIGLDTGAYETGVLSAARLDGAEVAVLQVGAIPIPAPPPEPEPAPAPRGWSPVAHPTDFTRGLGYET